MREAGTYYDRNRAIRQAYSRAYRDEVRAGLRTRTPRTGVSTADPKAHRVYHLQYSYGLTVDQYDAMLAQQGGVCFICGRPESSTGKSGFVKRLAVDHDHATGRVRSLLCASCNTVLGHVEADPGCLIRLGEYLAGSWFPAEST